MRQLCRRSGGDEAAREQPRQLLADVGAGRCEGARGIDLLRSHGRFLHDRRQQARHFLGDQRQPAARLVAAGEEGGAVGRPRLGERRAVERRVDHLVAQRLEARQCGGKRRHRAGLHGDGLQRRERLLDELHLLLQLQAEQPSQALAVLLARLLRVVEDLQRAVLAAVDQRREADHRLAAAADLEQLRQLAEVPVRDALLQFRRHLDVVAGHRLEALLRLAAELGAQLRQAAAHRQLPAVLVDHLEVHRQVRRQRLALEVLGPRNDRPLFPQVVDQRVGQQTAFLHPAAAALDEAGGVLGQRHAVPAQLLRQRLEQQVRLFLQHPRHQPVAARLVDLVEQVQRHRQRRPVARAAGLEVVGQGHGHAAHLERLREQFRSDARRLVPHQLVARQEEQPRVVPFRLRPPLVELRRGAYVDRHDPVVEGVDQFLVDQHVEPARLVLQLADLAHQLLVVGEERRARVEVAVDQRGADEDRARRLGVDRTEVHAPLLVDGQAVERRPLEGDHLPRLLLPVRLRVRLLQQVRPDLLDPRRLDAGHRAGEQARGLDQFSRHQPAAGFLHQRRAGPDEELDAARTGVGRLAEVGVEHARADVAEQPGEQRQVHRLERRRLREIERRVRLPAQLGHQRRQLRVHVAPLAHPPRRQEVLVQLVGELAVRLLVLDALVDEVPQLHEGQEVRALVGELAVRGVGRLLRRQRPLARVLHRQRGGDHQHLVQAVPLSRRQQHAADARVDRQPGQLAADRSQLVEFVDGVQFRQQLVAVGDRPRRRRLDERKLRDLAQVQRAHAQDHRRQRRAQDLRVGELRPLGELGFVVQADAHAVGDAAAAAGTLVGRRLRDRLDAQLLDLVAVGVALHPRQPGVDHVADAGHGERGLGDVGRQHDPPAGRAGPEDPLLLLDRQPRVQRQDLGRRPCRG